MKERNEVIEELNDVLEKTYDSVKGFQKAAEKAENNRLMGYFNEQVITRKKFVDELTQEVRNLGGEPKEDGTVQGSMHRAWINFKTALAFENDEELIEECITGEKNCIEEYDDLLEETGLPVSTRSLLIRQKMEVEQTLGQLNILEEAHDD